MAAGLTIREDNFDTFAAEFRRAARELLSDDALQPRLHLDHELAFAELNVDFLRWHEMLAAIWQRQSGSRLFFAREVEPPSRPRVVKDKHLVLRLRQRNHIRRAIFFDGRSVAVAATALGRCLSGSRG